MKKILAMFVAFACTLGAFADGIQANISGTDFSTYPVGVFTPGLNDSGEVASPSYWYTGFADDLDAEVVNLFTDEESGVVTNYLAFESNVTNPLYRTVNDCYGSVEDGILKNSGMAITNAFFIDTTVQFTPYLVNENHPAPTKTSDEDKIIVWVREREIDEGVCETNLIVTAGYIVGAGVQPKDYVVQMTPADVSALCQGQHRLTIKAFENITKVSGVTVMGFVVYIDRIAVSYASSEAAFNDSAATYVQLAPTPALYYTEETHKLFPSMVTPDQENTTDYSSITAVGFAGMGQIGEVWFDDYNTAYPEFAGDDINFTVVVGEGVESFEYQGVRYYETKTFSVPLKTESIEITGVLYDTEGGWTAKTNTWFVGETVVGNAGVTEGDSGIFYFNDGYVFTLAGFKANYEVWVAGVPSSYQTLFGNNGALKAALDNGGTLKLLRDLVIEETDSEFRNYIYVGEEDILTIDLNGNTLQGGDSEEPTIRNAGVLTVLDGSQAKDGCVWGGRDGDGTYWAIDNMGTLTLQSGIFGDITGYEDTTVNVEGGQFLDAYCDAEVPVKENFYLYDEEKAQYGLNWEERTIEGIDYWFCTVTEEEEPATPVAMIGETEYTSLADAIAAPTAEPEIKIIANIGTDSAFVIEKTVKIDLNGYTIATTENDTEGNGVFWVKTGGTLTINDTSVNRTGVINGVGGNGWNIGIFADNGKVIINGGNFTNVGATDDGPDGNHFDLIYVKNGGSAEITGGTFRCETPRWTLNKKNTTGGSFVVTGGKFYQYDPTNINTDDQPVTSWCPAGYKATLGNDGYYTVEEIPEVTVTLPVAPANTTLEAFVGEDEVEITDNVITVLAGSSVVLKLTADEGYEFSKDVTVHTTDAVVVNENADWSSTVLPAVTQIVTDPWAPTADTDAAAQTKVAEIFEGYPAAIASITTYDQYTNLVAYVKAVKEKEGVVDFAPEGLSDGEKRNIVDSLKLGAEKLFEAEPTVKVTSVTPETTAGNWTFKVTVTEETVTEDDEVVEVVVAVAKEKIEALVKVSTDLKTWRPAETTAVMEDKEVSVTVVNFGDGTTGFMKISE